MIDLKQAIHEAVAWYEPDAGVIVEGARRRLTRRRSRRRVQAAAAAFAVFALGALIVWTAFRTHPSTPATPEPTMGSRVTVATGTDPAAGQWELWVAVKDEGVGTHLAAGGGISGGCCSRGPLDAPLQPDTSGWTLGSPGHITAFATEDVRRVVFESATGKRIDAASTRSLARRGD